MRASRSASLVVAGYTFFIAFELWRERRKSLYSRTAAIVVPCLHAAIFLMPLAMRARSCRMRRGHWLTVFALETIIYAVGTAFIVLLMVKDHHVHVYRKRRHHRSSDRPAQPRAPSWRTRCSCAPIRANAASR